MPYYRQNNHFLVTFWFAFLTCALGLFGSFARSCIPREPVALNSHSGTQWILTWGGRGGWMGGWEEGRTFISSALLSMQTSQVKSSQVAPSHLLGAVLGLSLFFPARTCLLELEILLWNNFFLSSLKAKTVNSFLFTLFRWIQLSLRFL